MSPAAFALAEFTGMVRGDTVLKEEPNFEATDTRWQVKDEEEIFVLGTSIDGGWIEVIRRDGKSGWMPLNKVDLRRTDRPVYDDFYFAYMRERRITFRWNLELGLGWATAPIGVGAETMFRLNLFKNGMLTNKSDHFEIGTGFRYHLGAAPEPTLGVSGLETASAKQFWEVPVEFSLMFRLGYQGNFLVGPHFGVTFIQDPYGRFNPTMPAIAGFNFRYYHRDSVGIYWNTWVHLRSVIYYGLSFGVNWRF